MTAAPSSPAVALPTPVCVLGLGLIGGSLLRALHDAGHEAFGYNRSATTVDAAIGDGYDASADLVATLWRAASSDALLVLATPVTTIGPLVTAIAENAPGLLVTDVISVKQEVERLLADLHPGGRYVGGHPMAGTSSSGWAATDATLFDGAMWAVTTTDHTPADDWLTVAALAVTVGSRVVPVAPDAHDRAVAAISHLPHLTAAATAGPRRLPSATTWTPTPRIWPNWSRPSTCRNSPSSDTRPVAARSCGTPRSTVAAASLG